MNDHNLDDLIIDNLEPKNSKTKSFLTIIALLIVVLIVAIILTKIILKDPNAEKIAFEENNTEMISPELTLQSAAEPEVKKEEPKLSNIIEDALKAPIQAPKAPKEEVVKETEPVKIAKEIIETPEPAEVKTEVKNSAKEEEKLQQEYTEAREERLEKEKAEAKKAEAKQEAVKKEEAEKVVIEEVKVAKPVPPKMIEKAKVKPAGRPVNVPVKAKSATSQAFYIQVGSFTKTPSKQFLGIIKNSGFNYKITPKAANGTKKLLIGPYKNRTSANSALPRVKDRINKNAFVIKK